MLWPACTDVGDDDSGEDVDVTVTEDDSEADDVTETPRVKTPRRYTRVSIFELVCRWTECASFFAVNLLNMHWMLFNMFRSDL